MTRYLLDTNIVSNATKPKPSLSLERWMMHQSSRNLLISSLTVAEIRHGILASPPGKKRGALEDWFSGPAGPQRLFAERILSFDVEAALVWASLMAEAASSGRPRNELDTIIAAVAVANDCIVVTDNERDFVGVPTINPLRDPDAAVRVD